jgi:hypothetical protein
MFTKSLFCFLALTLLLTSCKKDDNDPNEIIQEPTLLQWYVDGDTDGFGNPDTNIGKLAATKPEGFVMDNSDCDDTNEDINPDAEEDEYDGIDSNCDNIAEVIYPTFSRTYGTEENDISKFLFQTSDGGYLSAGDQFSPTIVNFKGDWDFWLVKFDSNGQIEWEKKYGGPDAEYMRSMKQTSDGGYIIGGESLSNEGNVYANLGKRDWWIVKIDSIGEIQWVKTIGGSDSDYLGDIIETNDGNYLAVGDSWSDDEDFILDIGTRSGWFVKLDNLGNILWKSNIISQEVDAVVELDDGTFFASGTKSTGAIAHDITVYRIENTGEIRWSKELNTGFITATLKNILLASDESIQLAGSIFSEEANVNDAWLLNLSYDGDINRSKIFGGADQDVITSIITSKDASAYFITGHTTDRIATRFSTNSWLKKYNINGDLIWENFFGGSIQDTFSDMLELNEGGFLVSGATNSFNGDIIDRNPEDMTGNSYDLWLLKLKPNGKL